MDIKKKLVPIKRIKTIFAMIRKYGIHKTWIAYQESSRDSHYVMTDCPKCGTEHRVHKLRAARGMVRCTICRKYFIVTKATAEESAFMRAFARSNK